MMGAIRGSLQGEMYTRKLEELQIKFALLKEYLDKADKPSKEDFELIRRHLEFIHIKKGTYYSFREDLDQDLKNFNTKFAEKDGTITFLERKIASIVKTSTLDRALSYDYIKDAFESLEELYNQLHTLSDLILRRLYHSKEIYEYQPQPVATATVAKPSADDDTPLKAPAIAPIPIAPKQKEPRSFLRRHWGKIAGGLLGTALLVTGFFTFGIPHLVAAGIILGFTAKVGMAATAGVVGFVTGVSTGTIVDKSCCGVPESDDWPAAKDKTGRSSTDAFVATHRASHSPSRFVPGDAPSTEGSQTLITGSCKGVAAFFNGNGTTVPKRGVLPVVQNPGMQPALTPSGSLR